jgi:4'-phosphopantetheinyl transferase
MAFKGFTAGPLQWHSAGEKDIPAGLEWLTPRERERAEQMRYAKRRTDYLLGRFTAKSALAGALGLPVGADVKTLARIDIANASDGAPEPRVDGELAPASISMTDRAGWAVCLMGPPGRSLGCDLELVEPRTERFIRDYLTGPEVDRVLSEPVGPERDLFANLTWSAKESALKVLRTGLRRDTRSVEVAHGHRTSDGWHELTVTVDGERAFPGWWQRFGDFVLTIAADAGEPFPPPMPLIDPPGLASGAPSHAWMHRPLL